MSTSLLVSPCVLLEAVFVVEPPPKRVDIVINFWVGLLLGAGIGLEKVSNY